ncbi:hypothetical protein DUI87_03505 [Hirundo rustica rustica]|uniref:Reverse transcriptase/retrotransposon-derived protein RNase H-like domain-containing protein n=1 Tax=Hirundo rustica rustica TaxID=333673 RepID=A0A3M0L3D4_HIRRU|nr:hypothetical protein DUI87_03505 [Hirundo rustica rustica]
MSPPTNKKETQAFLGAIGFWRMYIPEYSQIVSPLYLVTHEKNDFHWGPEQQQAFAQIKQEIIHTKVPGETWGRPLGFWSRSYRGSEANYTPTEKEILATYEGVQAASEVIGTETQLLLAPRLSVLGWMFKGRFPSTHHAIDTTWSKRIALITQRACIGNPNRPGILEIITNWPEGETFGLSSEEEEEQVTRAEEAPPYNELPETERQYALFTDGSCKIVGANRKWKAARRDATYRWAHDQGVDLTMDNISQVIHNCEACAAIKQAKRVKPLWYGGRWLKYRHGEAWQIDYITLPQPAKASAMC